MPITDEQLTAYLDGELDAAEIARINAALATSPELTERLAALDFPVADIRAAFDRTLDAAPAAPTLPKVQKKTALPWLAAVAAAAVLGFGLGGIVLRQAAPDWTEVVANYQSLYVTDTLSAPPLAPETQRINVAALSGQLGVDLVPLIDLDDIQFRRAQMLGYEGAPLVQMAYLADDAVPIAICVTPISGGDTSVTQSRLFGMEAASWTTNGHGYLIIGGDDPALIEALAERVRAAI
ncbi:MAG: zf-HC2 domain-containing protein [Pseudomonadota bacterium]